MYNAIQELRVYPDFINGHFVQWEINPMFNGKLPYSFTLEVAETEDFSEIITSKVLGDVCFGIDDTNLKQGGTTNYFYRVKLNTADNKEYVSGALGFENYKDGARKYKMAANIMRNELNVHRFAGNDAYLLKRKQYGEEMKEAVDPITGLILANKKAAATAKAGGYYDPIRISIRSLSNEETLENSDDGMGTKDTIGATFRMIGFPSVTEYDVIVVMPINHRYAVRKISSNAYFPGSSIKVSQTLAVAQIPFTDPVYQIPVPIIKQS